LLYDRVFVEVEVSVVEFPIGRGGQGLLLRDLVLASLEQVWIVNLSSTTEACCLVFLLPSLFVLAELSSAVAALVLQFVQLHELLLPGLAAVRLVVVVALPMPVWIVGTLCWWKVCDLSRDAEVPAVAMAVVDGDGQSVLTEQDRDSWQPQRQQQRLVVVAAVVVCVLGIHEHQQQRDERFVEGVVVAAAVGAVVKPQ
jgi:hypothetical protein